MVDKPRTMDTTVVEETVPASTAPAAPRRPSGHRGTDVRDTVAELTARAQELSLEAGSKIAGAMRDVINAAAGLAGFAVESARDLVQYMVRRGQMTQEEADRLIREAEEAYNRRTGGRPVAPPTPPAAPIAPSVAASFASASHATPGISPTIRLSESHLDGAPRGVRPTSSATSDIDTAEFSRAAAAKKPAAKPAAKVSAKPAAAAKVKAAKPAKPAAKAAVRPAGKAKTSHASHAKPPKPAAKAAKKKR